MRRDVLRDFIADGWIAPDQFERLANEQPQAVSIAYLERQSLVAAIAGMGALPPQSRPEKAPGRSQVPVDYLKECFVYYPDSGDLMWRERPLSHFKTYATYRAFNAQTAHTVAGSVARMARGQPRYLTGITYRGTHYTFLNTVIITAIMTGQYPAEQVFAIDGNPMNTAWDNLEQRTRKGKPVK